MQKVTYEPSFRFIKIYTCVIAAVFPTEILEGYRMNQFFPENAENKIVINIIEIRDIIILCTTSIITDSGTRKMEFGLPEMD